MNAPPTRDCLQKGYVTRYVPIAHHTLPSITASGCIFDSCGDWVDSRLVGDDHGDSPCANPGVRTFVDMSECRKTCMATDVFGDGYVYIMTLEVQTIPECKTPTHPSKRYCSGGVYYEEGCIVTALCVMQADMTDVKNNNATWANLGGDARNVPVIGNDLRLSRRKLSQQIDLREAQPPVQPVSKKDVAITTRDLVVKHFKAIASAPPRALPFSELFTEHEHDVLMTAAEDISQGSAASAVPAAQGTPGSIPGASDAQSVANEPAVIPSGPPISYAPGVPGSTPGALDAPNAAEEPAAGGAPQRTDIARDMLLQEIAELGADEETTPNPLVFGPAPLPPAHPVVAQEFGWANVQHVHDPTHGGPSLAESAELARTEPRRGWKGKGRGRRRSAGEPPRRQTATPTSSQTPVVDCQGVNAAGSQPNLRANYRPTSIAPLLVPDGDRPSVGGRVCASCRKWRVGTQTHCECNEGSFWVIRDAALIPGVALINQTDAQGNVARNQRGARNTGHPERHWQTSRVREIPLKCDIWAEPNATVEELRT
jgi:hypothetical protein